MIDMEALGSEITDSLWADVFEEEEPQVLVVDGVEYLWLSDGVEGEEGIAGTEKGRVRHGRGGRGDDAGRGRRDGDGLGGHVGGTEIRVIHILTLYCLIACCLLGWGRVA